MAEYLSEEDMNTGEYISRDVALRQLNATCLATGCNNYNGVRCRACEYADAMDFIDAIPAADVQPIRHGRWEYIRNVKLSGTIKLCECNQCHNKIFGGLSYCGNCGARMDGGAKND